MKKHLLSFFALGTAFVLCPTLATAQVENPSAPNEGVPPPQSPMEEMMTSRKTKLYQQKVCVSCFFPYFALVFRKNEGD